MVFVVAAAMIKKINAWLDLHIRYDTRVYNVLRKTDLLAYLPLSLCFFTDEML